MLHFLPLPEDERRQREPFLPWLAPRRLNGTHLDYVRSRGCAVAVARASVRGARCSCRGPVQAHHVRTAANAGMGLKPPDSCAVGLCILHHRALHDLGRRTFEQSYGLDLAAIAARRWEESNQQEGEAA